MYCRIDQGRAIPVVCHRDNLLDSLSIQETHNLPAHLLEPIRFFFLRFVSSTISQQIRYDESIALAGEMLDLSIPVVAGFGEPMKEEDIGFFVLRLYMYVTVGRTIGHAGGSADGLKYDSRHDG